jgi:hypothetical protein
MRQHHHLTHDGGIDVDTLKNYNNNNNKPLGILPLEGDDGGS